MASRRAAGIVCGYFNSKHEIWGGEHTDSRGEELNAWAVVNQLEIMNNADSLPTFEFTNGRSWVDVTMLRGATGAEWMVLKEETLSDHRAVIFAVELEAIGDGVAGASEGRV